MATPLNVFKTVTFTVTTSNSTVYTAPTGFTGIILMAQVANVTGTDADVTFSHFDAGTSVETELAKDFTIPANDAGSVLTGKLVLESDTGVPFFANQKKTVALFDVVT